MNEQEFQQKLGDLIEQIGKLPESERAPLQQLAAERNHRHANEEDHHRLAGVA